MLAVPDSLRRPRLAAPAPRKRVFERGMHVDVFVQMVGSGSGKPHGVAFFGVNLVAEVQMNRNANAPCKTDLFRLACRETVRLVNVDKDEIGYP